MALLLAAGGVVTCGNCWKIDLHDLARHNRIEHDASLVHADAVPGCPFASTKADNARTQELLDITPAEYLTFEDLAHARALRDQQNSKSLDWLHTKIARGEIILTLKTLGEDISDTEDEHRPSKDISDHQTYSNLRVPKLYLSQWFGQDKLPDGWKRPVKRIQLRDVASGSRNLAREVRSLKRSRDWLDASVH